jgi:hypothetical protein
LRVIGQGAFTNSKIVSITIPKIIQVIGPTCFVYCPSLANVSFSPDS